MGTGKDPAAHLAVDLEVGPAGNVEAAVVDRAVGLIGIWTFASTPIKGFSYNPVTKVYTATVAVSAPAVGTSFTSVTVTLTLPLAVSGSATPIRFGDRFIYRTRRRIPVT